MTAFDKVLVRGDGVAACCCAFLLRRSGFRVAVERADRPRVPVIMLSEHAIALMRDVFERQSLFSNLPRIERRVVAWGPEAEAVALPHAACVLSEQVLLESLGDWPAEKGDDSPAGFTVYTSRPLPSGTSEMRFGSRQASAAQVTLRQGVDADACWIESLDDGWLFAIPNAAESAWLLAVGAPLESLLARSRVIAGQINTCAQEQSSTGFISCPRLLTPLCGRDWLACGSVAMGFDPICGDGTAQAVREAILAAAVVKGIAEGGDAATLLSHYETRLTAGMLRHLTLCGEFYRTGGRGRWWQSELAAMEDGARRCAERMNGAGEPRYRLRDFSLECLA